MTLTRKEAEELKPWVDRTVHKFLGFEEPTLVTAAVSCLSSGYDKAETARKLSSLLDDAKAASLADQLLSGALEQLRTKQRHPPPPPTEDEGQRKSRFSEMPRIVDQPSPGQLTSIQIREMMATAQRMIEERKKAFGGSAVPSAMPVAAAVADSRNRIAELSAQIHARIGSRPNFLQPPAATPATAATRPTPLILNAEGRTVDLTGREVQLAHHTPTLKANIRAQKREQFKIHQERVADDVAEQNFFDQRVGAKPAQRGRRAFRFHEKGKYELLAQRLRTRARLDRLQTEIAKAAKRTGISSATKIALMVPATRAKEGKEEVPDVEWWDTFIIKGESYDRVIEAVVAGGAPLEELLEGVTNLVEHPIQMKAPTLPPRGPAPLPVYLTQKERKKLRRQNRREAWKEKQEKIRLGLEPPPEPKVRMSNLMRVLGSEQVQDPTKVEAHVREQMAKRQRAHEEANASRKLTTEQRRDKKLRKLKEDTSRGVHVAVYRVLSLTNPAKKFKVEMNAKQLFLTGCVVLYRNVNLVVVEGGPRQQSKYRRLMLSRIKWGEETVPGEGDKVEKNQCQLVWEGTVKSRSFGEIKFKVCPSESLAREHFRKHGVEHYWDLAYSSTLLELADA